jgi:hypothetical protein
MKIIKIIFGVVAALFTIAYAVQFVAVLLNSQGNVRGMTEIAASLVPAALAAAISLILFQSAFRNSNSSNERP